jgi:hypothetical protein
MDDTPPTVQNDIKLSFNTDENIPKENEYKPPNLVTIGKQNGNNKISTDGDKAEQTSIPEGTSANETGLLGKIRNILTSPFTKDRKITNGGRKSNKKRGGSNKKRKSDKKRKSNKKNKKSNKKR